MIRFLVKGVITCILVIVGATTYRLLTSEKGELRFGKHQVSWDHTDEG